MKLAQKLLNIYESEEAVKRSKEIIKEMKKRIKDMASKRLGEKVKISNYKQALPSGLGSAGARKAARDRKKNAPKNLFPHIMLEKADGSTFENDTFAKHMEDKVAGFHGKGGYKGANKIVLDMWQWSSVVDWNGVGREMRALNGEVNKAS